MRLSDREWRPFELQRLFTRIESVKGKTTNDLIDGEGAPYIAASKVNNGYSGTYSITHHKEWLSEGNCIVFVLLGDGAAGWAHYEPMPFIGMNGKIACGYIDGQLNKFNGLFIAQCLRGNKKKYSHGHSWTGRRLLKTNVMLPVDSQGNPDYAFMEAYVRELMKRKLEQYQTYLEKRLAELENDNIVDIGGGGSLGEREWRPFYIGELFEVSRPVARTKAELPDGKIPFVASGSINNGVLRCCNVNSDERVVDRHCITVSPVDGSSFYHEYDFLGRGGAGSSILLLRNKQISKYACHFITVSLKLTCSCKYTYGHMGNQVSIKREQIMLPVDETGTPDFDYMERYGRALMKNKYESYLRYYARLKSQLY